MAILLKGLGPKLVFVFILGIILTIPTRPSWAEAKTFQNSLGMTFVLIPAGTFDMGSPPDEPHRNKDEVGHQVTISKPFYMQTTEVTRGQWKSLMGWNLFGRKRGKSRDKPKTKVSWHDGMRFVEKLNALNEGVYRLPTEAEWEYACRAGGQEAYSWGKTIECSRAMYGNNELKAPDCQPYVKTKGLPLDEPAPVMSYPPNAWGLYDMHGNVWEWCSDWYAKYPEDSVIDPSGPTSGKDKVRRGGSWFKHGWLCRSANRNYSHPASRYTTTGFRVVMDAEVAVRPQK
jgi:formylglycine-generating enzyme required for sulfatase activity